MAKSDIAETPRCKEFVRLASALKIPKCKHQITNNDQLTNSKYQTAKPRSGRILAGKNSTEKTPE